MLITRFFKEVDMTDKELALALEREDAVMDFATVTSLQVRLLVFRTYALYLLLFKKSL